MLRIYRTAPDITTLGPGNRFVIWTQGCRRRCPGCMSPDSRPMDGGRLVSEEALGGTVLRHAFDGVTVSGGEPFLQSAALTKLIRLIRAERDTGVILYTGYTYEELKALRDPDADALLGEIDLLIDGPYINALDDGGGWRGSSNQRAIMLTDRYRDFAENDFGKPGARRQQIHIDPDGLLIVGLRNNES